MSAALAKRSWTRPGRLVPAGARLRSRSMLLAPGGAVEWHSTGAREELLLVLFGALSLQRRRQDGRISTTRAAAGDSLHLSSGCWHRVMNRSRHPLRYVYVTG